MKSFRLVLALLFISVFKKRSAFVDCTDIRLNYTSSWFGNSGPNKQLHIPINADYLFVHSDGTAFSICDWDEGGHDGVSYRNGRKVGYLSDVGGGGWGRRGGLAITADSSYIYAVISQDGGYEYPPSGTLWLTVERYSREVREDMSYPTSSFAGGFGHENNMLILATISSSLTDQPKKFITGLALYQNVLYVSDQISSTIRKFSTTNLGGGELGRFNFSNPGHLAFDSQGGLWVLEKFQDPSSKPIPRLLRINKDTGAPLGQIITFPSGVVPKGFAISGNLLLIADDGVNQNIRIYENITTSPKFKQYFGNIGGINSDTPGLVAPRKLNGPSGVGLTAKGDIIVANAYSSGGGGVVVESYSFATGKRNWAVHGILFVDCAEPDPFDSSIVYTKEEIFKMNYNRKKAGSEWNYFGFTINRFKYPNDSRVWGSRDATMARALGGTTILFMTDMYASGMYWYRFNKTSDGMTAIPAGAVRHWCDETKWPFNKCGDDIHFGWLWLDLNGNGQMEYSEFANTRVDNIYGFAYFVGQNGDIWYGQRENGVNKWVFQGLNSFGVPIYDANGVKYQTNAMQDIKRIEYVDSEDTLYLCGFTTAYPDVSEDTWWSAGRVVQRYDNWHTNRTKRWDLVLTFLPNVEGNAPKSMAIGGKYVFVAFGQSARIEVYDSLTAQKVGFILPGPEISYQTGWLDIPQAIRVHVRPNGEYLIFAEEDWLGKIIMYRWTPSA